MSACRSCSIPTGTSATPPATGLARPIYPCSAPTSINKTETVGGSVAADLACDQLSEPRDAFLDLLLVARREAHAQGVLARTIGKEGAARHEGHLDGLDRFRQQLGPVHP